jgi:hypothetical protein
MSAEIVNLPSRTPKGQEKAVDMPLQWHVDGALFHLREMQEAMKAAAEVNLNRRKGATKKLEMHLCWAVDRLEKCMASIDDGNQKELRRVMLEALGPKATVSAVLGAQNMLAIMHDALAEFPKKL